MSNAQWKSKKKGNSVHKYCYDLQGEVHILLQRSWGARRLNLPPALKNAMEADRDPLHPAVRYILPKAGAPKAPAKAQIL